MAWAWTELGQDRTDKKWLADLTLWACIAGERKESYTHRGEEERTETKEIDGPKGQGERGEGGGILDER